MNNSKITLALYDSGIGGLSLLNEVCKTFKGVNIIYFGDNENAPYGNKPASVLYSLCKTNVKKLFYLGANVVTLACNTLSTTVLNNLIKDGELNNLGVITGVFPPPPTTNNSALLCTVETAKSNFIKQNFLSCVVIPLPFLAGEIERFFLTPEKINLVADLKNLPSNVSEIILGCTHYSLIKNLIIKKLSSNRNFTSNLAVNKITITDGISNALIEVKRAVNKVISNRKTEKTGKNNELKVTFNHQALVGAKTVTVNDNKVFFIGEKANYNKKVFNIYRKRLQK